MRQTNSVGNKQDSDADHGDNAETTNLNQEQDDGLAKARPMSGRVYNSQTRDAHRARGGE